MRVLPDVVAAEDEVLSECLLEPRVKLVAITRRHDVGDSRCAVDKVLQNCI